MLEAYEAFGDCWTGIRRRRWGTYALATRRG